MVILKIDIDLLISNNNPDEARIIHETLSPDNLATLPMTISSKRVESKIEIKITNVQNTDTAIATINDILDSYELSKDILEKVKRVL